MRIEINLALPESRLERSVYLWAPAIIALASILLVRILVSAGHRFIDYRQVHRSVLRYQAETTELQARENRAQSVLRQPATLKLYQQINFLNALIEQKQVSLADLTLRVSRLLPAQARLQALSLAQSEAGPALQFSVEGATAETVYRFLNQLEDSPDFDSVTVTDQTIEAAGPDKGMVSVICSARYVGHEPLSQDPKQP